jgi:hypothetical protein
MEKKVVACDFCKQVRISAYKCELCNKDMCEFHTNIIRTEFYNPKNRYSYKEDIIAKPIILKFMVGNNLANSISGITICKECSERYINILDVLSKGKEKHIIRELMDKMEELAKVEVI